MKSKIKFRYSFVKHYDPFKYFKDFKIKDFFNDILYPLDQAIQCPSFIEIAKVKSHFHKVKNHKLIKAGFKTIVDIAAGQTVYQLKTTKTGRLLGLMLKDVFYIIGYDAKHTIYS